MREIDQEFAQALKEGRQPRCPDCKKPLEIRQDFYEIVAFRWDKDERCYHKFTIDRGTERPFCQACKTEFSIFIGDTPTQCHLGLFY